MKTKDFSAATVLTLVTGIVLLSAQGAQGDEIGFSCDGAHASNVPYDAYDASSVSVKAHLEALLEVKMLGDEDSSGEFTMLGATLSLVATNDHQADAGSFEITAPLKGKLDHARDPRFADHVKFDLGSKIGAAYTDDGDEPETYLLIPTGDAADQSVFVQRQGSGHDTYPTITLDCR